MQKTSRYKQLLSQSLPSESIISGENPFTLRMGGQMFYLYLRALSWAHFPSPDVWRAQLPRDKDFDDIKVAKAPFIFLGYDEDNDVYATWEPVLMKSRLNAADYVSVYSRLSVQVEAARKNDFQKYLLNNGEFLLTFPSSMLKDYLLNFDKYFEGTTQEKAYIDYSKIEPISLFEDFIVAEPKGHIGTTDWESPFLVNGKLTKLANPELLDLLKPCLSVEYPNKKAALETVQQFYGTRFADTMEFQDWVLLFNQIDWANPYTKLDAHGAIEYKSLREKIRIVFPDGREIKPKKVTQALLEVIKYAGPEKVLALNLKNGNQDLILTSNPNNESHIKPISDSLFIDAKSKTRTKYRHICDISEKLNLGLEVFIE